MSTSDFSPQQQRLLSLMAELNRVYQWGLPLRLQEEYVSDIMQNDYISGDDDQQLKDLLIDYRLVQVLSDNQDPCYEAAWDHWMKQVIPILKRCSYRINDPMIDIDDMAQNARLALIQALPKFKFRSKFSTWVFQVVTYSAYRLGRDAKAEKRAQRPSPLDEVGEKYLASPDNKKMQDEIDYRAMYDTAVQILGQLSDQRLRVIFEGRVNDETIEELAVKLCISPQRVRALVKLIRKILSADPNWRDWCKPRDDNDD